MKKFSNVNEGKIFIADPSIIKKYAAFIIPLFLCGKLKYDEALLDEYLDLYKRAVKDKNANIISDLDIYAVKTVLQENPISQGGFDSLKKEIEKGCPKLEKFLRAYIIDSKTYLT